ncbi:kelch repeat-containing protein [Streptomyces sp. NPDC048290]|uniref:Kelch repeat-containing protein n=1 Tax=Streptomyces sp. NPDC048290 TaxID=3155811 RepID=UPI00341EE650
MTSPTPAATGDWTTTGDLPAATAWHGQDDGAVLLTDGKGVLVAGGADPAGAATARTARYDPGARTWTAGRPLSTPRRLHTTTLLADGRVLVTGGTGGTGTHPAGLASAELYDPADGTWTTVAALGEARWGHTAVLLDGGKVLVTGGRTTRDGTSARALASAEVFDPDGDPDDPVKGAWTAAPPMLDARSGHGAVLFKGGRVLVTGGTAPISPDRDTALAFCELFDPSSGPAGAWTPAAPLAAPRAGHRTVLTGPTTALVVGGATPGSRDPYAVLGVERYDLAAATWTARPATDGGRAHHRVLPLGGTRFLVVGGTTHDDHGLGYRSALVYDDAGPGAWSRAAGTAEGRWGCAAAVLGAGRVLVTGGTLASGVAAPDPDTAELTRTTEVFDLAGDGS